MALPASGFGVPVALRLTTSGLVAFTSLAMLDPATGRIWLATVTGTPPAWVFTAAPSCAEIAADFTRSGDLAAAVGTCAQLITWGY